MAMEPNRPHPKSRPRTPEEEEYRRRQALRDKKRKKRRNQQLILLGAFLLGIIIVVVCIVFVFKAIFGGKKQQVASSSSIASVSQAVAGVPWPTAADPNVWNLKLVNKQLHVEEGFTFEEGQIAQGPIAYFFDARIVDSLNQMIADCNAVEGHSLAIISGRCGPTTQNNKHNYWVEVFKAQGYDDAQAEMMGSEIEPPAGQSEHQIGLAVDFVTGTVQDSSKEFAQTPEYQWLIEHCTDYGFILRFPETKESITGILFQPYHFRYVGVEDAKIITQAGICLEEYLADTSGMEMPQPEQQPVSSATSE